MSVFRRGVRIAHGAHVDELPSDDSDSDTEDELEMHAREEKAEVSDVGEEEDDSGPVNLNWKYEPDPNAVESEEEEEERPEGAEPQFPITCALCSGKTLFSMKEVTDHMASARHQKKEKESEQALKKAKRTPDQIEKLKMRNARKKQKKLDTRIGERKHVWGEHKKGEKPEGAKPVKPAKGTGGKKTVKGGKSVGGGKRGRADQMDEDDLILADFRNGRKEVGVSGAPDAKAARRENREAMTVPLKASKRADGRAKMRGEGNQHQRRFGKKTAPAGGE